MFEELLNLLEVRVIVLDENKETKENCLLSEKVVGSL